MDEFREQLGVIFGAPAEPALDLAHFEEALDDRLRRNHLATDDVVSELYRGIVGARMLDADRPDRRQYRLITPRLEVSLHTERSDRGRAEITVLDNARVRRDRSSEQHAPVHPARVNLYHPTEAPPCDLDLIIREVDNRRHRLEAERTLSRVRLTPRLHAELRNQTRRRYGSLRTLFELGRQQARFGDKAIAYGTVVDGAALFGQTHPAARELVVRLDTLAPFATGDDASQLAIWPSDNPDAAITLEAAEIVDDLVVLGRPDRRQDADTVRRQLSVGARVVVSEAGEFRYGRHAYALHTFLDERIVGNWTALATLLCQPENLIQPPYDPVAKEAGRPLNDAQRTAVGGALAAPHAYLVQGPPGTGKTQVITEIVSRLVARGERVLLTAPTHVALDEVLRRIATESGVLPLRLSWNDRYVADDVQRFTLSGYDRAIADVRTPASSRSAEWKLRLRRVSDQRNAVVAWQALVPRRDSAVEALTAARRIAADRAAWHAQQVRDYDATMNQWHNVSAFHGAELARLDGEARGLQIRRVTAERSRGLFARALDALGLGPVSRLARQEERLSRLLADCRSRYAQARQGYEHCLASRAPLVATLTDRERADLARIGSEEDALAEIERQLVHATHTLTELDLHHLQIDHAAAADAIRAFEESQRGLEALVDVQQLWFDTIGATGSDEAADRERANEVVRRALSSAANLICSTTTGFGGARPFRDLDYDTLIVDEASKVTAAEFLISAQRAHRWILVGDEKQLDPYVDTTVEHHLHAMAAIHLAERDRKYTVRTAVEHLASLWRTVDDEEQRPFRVDTVDKVAQRLLSGGAWVEVYRQLYAEQIMHVPGADTAPERWLLEAMRDHLVTSLFTQCVTRTRHGQGYPRHRLVEQRRMTPEIAELVRLPVYHGDYVSPPADDPDLPRPLLIPSFQTPVVFLDTSTQSRPWDELPEGKTSFVNKLEADWVVEVCRRWNDELGHMGTQSRTSVSVLAFYGAQARLIRSRLGHPRYARFPNLDFRVVDSIDRIQGQQSDIVVVSFCRTFGRPSRSTRRPARSITAPPPGWAPWLQNINRLNVACTRARRSIVLIGHGPTLRGLTGKRAAEAFYHNLFGLPSDILSVTVDWAPARTGS